MGNTHLTPLIAIYLKSLDSAYFLSKANGTPCLYACCALSHSLANSQDFDGRKTIAVATDFLDSIELLLLQHVMVYKSLNVRLHVGLSEIFGRSLLLL